MWTAILGAGPILVYREIALLGTLPPGYFVTLGYAMLGGNLLIPTVWHCRKYNQRAMAYIIAAVSAFAIALVFRQFDFALAGSGWLPTGSHFLWHLFGGIATWLLLHYIYLEPAETGD